MSVELASEADLPTAFGMFRIYAFMEGDKEHIALVHSGGAAGQAAVPVRIHSRCMTGDTFSSLRCDCRAQLEGALEYIAKRGSGVLVYLDQEGRGIGLCNKVRAYALQDRGMDTVEANLSLGFAEDLREYGAAAEILRHLGVGRIELITNNPQKIDEMRQFGIAVDSRIPLVVKPTEFNERYLKAKKEKLQHLME